MTIPEKIEKVKERKRKSIERYDAQIQKLRDQCVHDESVKYSNDHDGWTTYCTINYTAAYTCRICGNRREVHSQGKER